MGLDEILPHYPKQVVTVYTCTGSGGEYPLSCPFFLDTTIMDLFNFADLRRENSSSFWS
jgi:hypothetical protein